MAEPISKRDDDVVGEARALLARNQPAEAARILRLYLSAHPGAASEYMLLGVALLQSGQGLLALHALEQAAAMEPESVDGSASFGIRTGGAPIRPGARERAAAGRVGPGSTARRR